VLFRSVRRLLGDLPGYDALKPANWSGRPPRPAGAEDHSSSEAVGFAVTPAMSSKSRSSREGKLTIDRIWCSIDSGTIVSFDRVLAQVQGAAVMACSHAVFGELTFKQGRTVQTNFDSFHVAKMSEAPKDIVVDIVPSEAAPVGVGETGVPSTAPAL